MTVYVVSTRTNSIAYCIYEQNVQMERGAAGPNMPILPQIPKILRKIVINGGAGLPSFRSGFGEQASNTDGVPLWTASGIVTPVSDSDYELLKENYVFKKHLARNLVRVVDHDLRGNHKAVIKEVKQMEPHDGFAQLNKETLNMKIKVSSKMAENESSVDFRI